MRLKPATCIPCFYSAAKSNIGGQWVCNACDSLPLLGDKSLCVDEQTIKHLSTTTCTLLATQHAHGCLMDATFVTQS